VTIVDTTKVITEQIPCDGCGGGDWMPYIDPPSCVIGMADESRVVRCSSCGLLYTNPRLTQESLARCYDGYYSGSAVPAAKRPVASMVQAKRVFRHMWHFYCGQYLSEVLEKVHGKVLDVGCGTGGLLVELRNKGCEPYGVEFNPVSVETCRKKGLDVRCGNFVDTDLPECFFDMVIFWHSIEHLPSPRRALIKAFALLKPGGTMFIHSPNAKSYLACLFGRSWHAWQLPFHLFHFDVFTIGRAAKESGFAVAKLRTATPEYFFAHSLAKAFSGSRSALCRWLHHPNLYRSLPFRMIVAMCFRIVDACFPRGGECLRGEFSKPVDRTG
jgi:SAM-dependent methyltransferase